MQVLKRALFTQVTVTYNHTTFSYIRLKVNDQLQCHFKMIVTSVHRIWRPDQAHQTAPV